MLFLNILQQFSFWKIWSFSSKSTAPGPWWRRFLPDQVSVGPRLPCPDFCQTLSLPDTNSANHNFSRIRSLPEPFTAKPGLRCVRSLPVPISMSDPFAAQVYIETTCLCLTCLCWQCLYFTPVLDTACVTHGLSLMRSVLHPVSASHVISLPHSVELGPCRDGPLDVGAHYERFVQREFGRGQVHRRWCSRDSVI